MSTGELIRVARPQCCNREGNTLLYTSTGELIRVARPQCWNREGKRGEYTSAGIIIKILRVRPSEIMYGPVVGANPNPDLQIQYSIQIFVKLYLDLDCIYGFKIKLYYVRN